MKYIIVYKGRVPLDNKYYKDSSAANNTIRLLGTKVQENTQKLGITPNKDSKENRENANLGSFIVKRVDELINLKVKNKGPSSKPQIETPEYDRLQPSINVLSIDRESFLTVFEYFVKFVRLGKYENMLKFLDSQSSIIPKNPKIIRKISDKKMKELKVEERFMNQPHQRFLKLYAEEQFESLVTICEKNSVDFVKFFEEIYLTPTNFSVDKHEKKALKQWKQSKPKPKTIFVAPKIQKTTKKIKEPVNFSYISFFDT